MQKYVKTLVENFFDNIELSDGYDETDDIVDSLMNGLETVDLCLPSGTLWVTKSLGCMTFREAQDRADKTIFQLPTDEQARELCQSCSCIHKIIGSQEDTVMQSRTNGKKLTLYSGPAGGANWMWIDCAREWQDGEFTEIMPLTKMGYFHHCSILPRQRLDAVGCAWLCTPPKY